METSVNFFEGAKWNNVVKTEVSFPPQRDKNEKTESDNFMSPRSQCSRMHCLSVWWIKGSYIAFVQSGVYL